MIVILLDKLPPSRKIGQNKSAKNQRSAFVALLGTSASTQTSN
jgi:hypothetical protein